MYTKSLDGVFMGKKKKNVSQEGTSRSRMRRNRVPVVYVDPMSGIEYHVDVGHLISYASRLEGLFVKRDVRKIKHLYHELVNDLIIEFDPFKYKLAVVAYMLAKFLSKPRMWSRKGIAGYVRKIGRAISDFVFFAKKGNLNRMMGSLDKITHEINNLDAYDQRYVSSLLENTYIKIGATMYAKGISLHTASQKTGIPPHKILEYIGKTTMADRLKSRISPRERLSWVENLL